MWRAAVRSDQPDPQRLLLWMPLLAAVIGVALLDGLHLVSPLYLAILAATGGFVLLALFGPQRLRPVLLAAAPASYVLLLLLAWLASLYVLPLHPATPMVQLAVVLHLPVTYVFFFVQRSPQAATRRAAAALTAFLGTALPHSWQSYGYGGAFDGVTLPLTLLLAHGALILVLRFFSELRERLVRAETRMQALYELAHRDPLTHLHNRRALEQDLARTVQEERQGCVLAVVDVDGLKRVNDTLGHAAGDDLLRRFASGFARVVQPHGRAYRLSGDEFALLLGESGAAEPLVALVTREVSEVYAQAGASVGTAQRQDGETESAWLSRADRAMYRHKASKTGGERPE